MTWARRPGVWVFAILIGTYADFWQSRDWNSASRLMLTYAIAERGSVRIDGLETQTGDRARVGSHYFSDKMPGLSIAAIPPYLAARWALGLPDHPLHARAMTHWAADYWATLGTAGLATAAAGVILCGLAIEMGCGPRAGAFVGLAYGLATPAFPYATMAYGHQPAALALIVGLVAIRSATGRHAAARVALAAASLSAAVAFELSMAPVAALLGLILLVRAARGDVPPRALVGLAAGLVPLVVVAGYNLAAFGSPIEMGYFHEDLAEFRAVHSATNPLGLMHPDWSHAPALLWGRHRGLAFYAPILLLTPIGWLSLLAGRRWSLATASIGGCVAVFLVNLSYPNWTGGWSTGPRLLVPMIPFAMIGVAAFLSRSGRLGLGLAGAAAIFGGVVLFGCVTTGARFPSELADPVREAVIPLWAGSPKPRWWVGDRFARNFASIASPRRVRSLPADLAWLQWAPLLAFQGAGIAGMWAATRGLGVAASGRGGIQGATPDRADGEEDAGSVDGGGG